MFATEGVLELFGVEHPSEKQLGAAALFADFLIGGSRFFFPKE